MAQLIFPPPQDLQLHGPREFLSYLPAVLVFNYPREVGSGAMCEGSGIFVGSRGLQAALLPLLIRSKPLGWWQEVDYRRTGLEGQG